MNNINAVHCSLCFLSVSSGIHILQSVSGCEWDESTGEMINFLRYAYNGEDFLEFDMKTLRWITLKPEAVITKQRWDTDENRKKKHRQVPQYDLSKVAEDVFGKWETFPAENRYSHIT